ncbi:hypothetical protein [Sessilibacter corallicola]
MSSGPKDKTETSSLWYDFGGATIGKALGRTESPVVVLRFLVEKRNK